MSPVEFLEKPWFSWWVLLRKLTVFFLWKQMNSTCKSKWCIQKYTGIFLEDRNHLERGVMQLRSFIIYLQKISNRQLNTSCLQTAAMYFDESKNLFDPLRLFHYDNCSCWFEKLNHIEISFSCKFYYLLNILRKCAFVAEEAEQFKPE